MKNKIKENCTFYEVLKETIENKAWCFRLPNWPKYTYANLSIQRPNIFSDLSSLRLDKSF